MGPVSGGSNQSCCRGGGHQPWSPCSDPAAARECPERPPGSPSLPGVPRGHCGPDPSEALGRGWLCAPLCSAPGSRLPQGRASQGLQAGRTGPRSRPPDGSFLGSRQTGPPRLLGQASYLSPGSWEDEGDPTQEAGGTGACQLQPSPPPRSCRRGLSRGAGAPPTVPRRWRPARILKALLLVLVPSPAHSCGRSRSRRVRLFSGPPSSPLGVLPFPLGHGFPGQGLFSQRHFLRGLTELTL